jgi:MFS family permease
LRNRNFRLYLAGQGLSQFGTWFQLTAEIWLIVEITGSGKAVGLHSVLRFGPLLLFGIPGSLFSGRFARRRFLVATQSVYGVAALVLTVASFVWSPTLGLIYAMVGVQGLVNAIDNPVKRSFIRDMVTDEELSNALSLNSSMEVLTRTIGPAIGGVVIVIVGAPWCFAFNTLSFSAVLTSLCLMDRSKLRPPHRLTNEPGQLRAGFRYAWANRRIRRTLLMSTVVFLFAWNWQVVLPVYSSEVLDGDASVYGLLVGLLGVGAFIATLVVARVRTINGRYFRIVCALLAAALVIAGGDLVPDRRGDPPPAGVRRHHDRPHPGALRRGERGRQAARRRDGRHRDGRDQSSGRVRDGGDCGRHPRRRAHHWTKLPFGDGWARRPAHHRHRRRRRRWRGPARPARHR